MSDSIPGSTLHCITTFSLAGRFSDNRNCCGRPCHKANIKKHAVVVRCSFWSTQATLSAVLYSNKPEPYIVTLRGGYRTYVFLFSKMVVKHSSTCSECRASARLPYNPGDYAPGRNSSMHAPRHGYDGQGSDYGQPAMYGYDAPQSRPGVFSGDRHG